MNEQLIFCLVFSLQVFCISYYLPARLAQRAKTVFANYPQEQYPKLYPKTEQELRRALRIFMGINGINVCIGLGLLLGLILLGPLAQAQSDWASRFFDEMMPFYYYMLQILPFLLVEIFGFKLTNLMRIQGAQNPRSAELKPRKLTDFAHTTLLYGALACYVALAFLVTLLYTQVTQDLPKALSFILLLLAGNGVFSAIIYWNIYSANRDPFASQSDRDRRIGSTVNGLLRMSIASSLYCSLIALVDVYFHDQGAAILISVFLQITMAIGFGLSLIHI